MGRAAELVQEDHRTCPYLQTGLPSRLRNAAGRLSPKVPSARPEEPVAVRATTIKSEHAVRSRSANVSGQSG
jgi:hypothetical protein